MTNDQKHILDSLNLKPCLVVPGYSLFTKEEADRLRTYYFQHGVTHKAIADHLGVSVSSIQRAITRTVKFSRVAGYTRRQLSEKEIEAIRVDYKKGLRIPTLAGKYNVCYKTVRRHTSDLRAEYSNYKYLSRDTIEEIRQDYKDGMSYEDIGKKHNRTKSSFYRHIADLIPKHGRRRR